MIDKGIAGVNADTTAVLLTMDASVYRHSIMSMATAMILLTEGQGRTTVLVAFLATLECNFSDPESIRYLSALHKQLEMALGTQNVFDEKQKSHILRAHLAYLRWENTLRKETV